MIYYRVEVTGVPPDESDDLIKFMLSTRMATQVAVADIVDGKFALAGDYRPCPARKREADYVHDICSVYPVVSAKLVYTNMTKETNSGRRT